MTSSLAAIHIGKKNLGLDDETYRSMLRQVTGQDSARDLSEAQRQDVITEMRRRGFQRAGKSTSNGRRKPLEGKFAKKLQALWIAGWNLGIVGNRDDAALLAFVKRQTGIDHVRFLRHPEDAAKAIEALKGWMAREAKVDWTDGDHKPAWMRCPGAKVALAQWAILARAGAVQPGFDAFRRFVEDHAFRPIWEMTPTEWAGVMNTLGERVRQVRS